MSRSIVIGTAGHIDHGKSALVQALTGTDPDRLKEEKARGITIDLGFAHTSIDHHAFAFVDVPGHERFVKNMLAGVGGIDAVLLVVAADESVMPQTREHFAICRLLQVPAGVIALTKSDLADPETIEIAAMDVRELVAGSPLQHASIVPVSSRTGAGLDELKAALAAIAGAVPERPAEGRPPRLPVDRVFSVRGFGTVVTGTLNSGILQVDDDLVLLPSGTRVKVRGLQVHGVTQTTAAAGRRVAVNLSGVDVADVARGDTLTVPDAFETTRRFDAVLELLPDAPPLKHGARIRFHHGTAEILGRVALAPGGYARLRLEAPAVLTRGDRFILRAYSPSMTIGGGVVLDPLPARSPIRTTAAAGRFSRLAGSAADAVSVFAKERGASGVAFAALARRVGMPVAAVRTVALDLASTGDVTVAAEHVVTTEVVRGLEQRLLETVAAHHAADPIADGLPREEARERLFARAAPGLFEYVLDALARDARLVARERLSLPGRGVSLTAEEARALDVLGRAFRAGGLAPPDVAAAAAAAKLAPALVERVVRLLLRQKALVKIDALYFDAAALASLKRDVLAMKEPGQTARLDVAAFKERFGVSRKYAIPLLEWLDRERVTRRVGDARIVL